MRSLSELFDTLRSFRFRVRDVTVMRDYLCLSRRQQPGPNLRSHFILYCLDDGLQVTRSGEESKYCLLSSPEEMSVTHKYTELTLFGLYAGRYRHKEFFGD